MNHYHHIFASDGVNESRSMLLIFPLFCLEVMRTFKQHLPRDIDAPYSIHDCSPVLRLVVPIGLVCENRFDRAMSIARTPCPIDTIPFVVHILIPGQYRIE